MIYRDLGGNAPPAITEQWIASAFTTEADRSADQKAALAVSDTYINELEQADVIVMGAPMTTMGCPLH